MFDLLNKKNTFKTLNLKFCKKCRDYAKDFAKQSREKNIKKDIPEDNKWCNMCNEIKSKDQFIHEIWGSMTARCKKCRDENKIRETEQKKRLKEAKPTIGKRKCIQCNQIRDAKFYFSTKSERCKVCVESNKKATARKREKRKAETVEKYTKLTGKIMCSLCKDGFNPDDIMDGKCETCRTTKVCTRCEEQLDNSYFILNKTNEDDTLFHQVIL